MRIHANINQRTVRRKFTEPKHRKRPLTIIDHSLPAFSLRIVADDTRTFLVRVTRTRRYRRRGSGRNTAEAGSGKRAPKMPDLRWRHDRPPIKAAVLPRTRRHRPGVEHVPVLPVLRTAEIGSDVMLPANAVLHRLAYDVADDVRVRRGRRGAAVRLLQLRLRCRLVGPRTPRRRPTRGDAARLRRPLHRRLAQGRVPPSLRGDLMRPRPGREPDQAAQGPTRLRPHFLPEPARQSVPADPPHPHLLADFSVSRCILGTRMYTQRVH